jgi:hypothetical protein
VGPIGLTGVIVYWTNGILVMPAQERDTPTTLEVASIVLYALRLIGVAVDNAKPVVLSWVATITVAGAGVASIFCV